MSETGQQVMVRRLEPSDFQAVRNWFRSPDFYYLTGRPETLDSGAIRTLLHEGCRRFYLVTAGGTPAALAHWDEDPDDWTLGAINFRVVPGAPPDLADPCLESFLKTVIAVHNPTALISYLLDFDREEQRALWERHGFEHRGTLRQAAYKGRRHWDVHVYQLRRLASYGTA